MSIARHSKTVTEIRGPFLAQQRGSGAAIESSLPLHFRFSFLLLQRTFFLLFITMDNASQDGCVVAAVEQIMAYARSLIEDNFSSQLVDNIALGVAVIAGAVVLGEVKTMILAGYDWWFQSHSSSKNAATIKADDVIAMQSVDDSGDGRQLRFDGANCDENRINRNLRRALQSRLIGVGRYRSRCRRDLGNETEDTCQLPSFNDREKRLDSIEKKMDQMTFELGELQKRIDKLTGRFTCGECCDSTAHVVER